MYVPHVCAWLCQRPRNVLDSLKLLLQIPKGCYGQVGERALSRVVASAFNCWALNCVFSCFLGEGQSLGILSLCSLLSSEFVFVQVCAFDGYIRLSERLLFPLLQSREVIASFLAMQFGCSFNFVQILFLGKLHIIGLFLFPMLLFATTDLDKGWEQHATAWTPSFLKIFSAKLTSQSTVLKFSLTQVLKTWTKRTRFSSRILSRLSSIVPSKVFALRCQLWTKFPRPMFLLAFYSAKLLQEWLLWLCLQNAHALQYTAANASTFHQQHGSIPKKHSSMFSIDVGPFLTAIFCIRYFSYHCDNISL